MTKSTGESRVKRASQLFVLIALLTTLGVSTPQDALRACHVRYSVYDTTAMLRMTEAERKLHLPHGTREG